MHYLSTLVQHWACVYHSPAPQTRPPLPLCFFGASPSARPQQSPSRRAFTTEMAVKVCRSVLLLSRSSGAVASSRPALVVSPQRHHQHIRPVSPRTSETAPRERGRERGRDRAGEAGPERRQAGLAKEVKLTSVNISPPFIYFFEVELHVKVRHTTSHDTYPNLVSRGYFNPRWDVEVWQRGNAAFWSTWNPSTPRCCCPAVYCN